MARQLDASELQSDDGQRAARRAALSAWKRPDAGDLAGAIDGPPIYALEGIPSTIRREDIERALKAARCDRSALGRRDYAMLMLLSSYGLRAGEVMGLRLSDIDWRHERLRIRHTKTGAYSELPLLRGPADALLDYLQHGRPATTFREVFLRVLAPYRPLSSVASAPFHDEPPTSSDRRVPDGQAWGACAQT